MNQFTEVTAQNLSLIRGAKGLNQDEIAEILGIPKTAVSNIENDKRSLSSSEKALLDLYFFGAIPFEITNETLQQSILEFTPLQWRVISILANKNGMTPGKWIANQIRSFLAYDEEGRKVLESQQEKSSPITLVAEDPTPYRAKLEGN